MVRTRTSITKKIFTYRYKASTSIQQRNRHPASGRASLESYAREKGKGEPGRPPMEATVASARRRVATLLRCDPTSVAFTYSASDALGLLTQSIPWNVGDRVVVSQIEYPSDLLVWHQGLDGTRLHLDVVDEDAFTWSTQAIAEKMARAPAWSSSVPSVFAPGIGPRSSSSKRPSTDKAVGCSSTPPRP